MGKIDIINSTLGKALGGASGGYTTGPREVISLLRQKSRPYLFSNSLPPAVVGAASKVSLQIRNFVWGNQNLSVTCPRFCKKYRKF